MLRLFFLLAVISIGCTSKKDQSISLQNTTEQESAETSSVKSGEGLKSYIVRGNLNNSQYLLLCQRNDTAFWNYLIDQNKFVKARNPLPEVGKTSFFYLYKEGDILVYSIGNDESSITKIKEESAFADYPEYLIVDALDRNVLMVETSYVKPPHLFFKPSSGQTLDLGIDCTGALFMSTDTIIVTQNSGSNTLIKTIRNIKGKPELIKEFNLSGNLTCFGYNPVKDEVYLTAPKGIISFDLGKNEIKSLYSDYVITPVFIKSAMQIFFVVDGIGVKSIKV